ncbi:MAG TPA: META domain-containing protein [Acidimicrobiia bacterium]|jgi:heat shock protein HslJ|nr:META domain-containing protein [Acidimicrobiia bacterium]
MRKAIALVAILAIALTACADPGEEGASDPTANAWVLETGTLDGADIPIVDGFPITLIFDQPEGTAGGKSACNQWFGGYTLSGNELTFTDVGGTMMACVDEGVMETEAAFLDAMSQVELFTMEGDELNLTGEAVDLLFVVDETATTTTS